MPVRLDRVCALAPRPARPRVLLWLGQLPLLLVLGMGLTFMFGSQALGEQPIDFWGLALGVPLLGWCALSFARVLIYMGQQRAADGWDEARQDDLNCRIRQGRRSQQVLGVSLYTAFREPGAQPAAQLDFLLNGNKSLKAQPSWLGGAPLRHSRLRSGAEKDAEIVLLRVLTHVLAELAQSLAHLPDDAPLALLLEIESGLSESLLRRVWQQAWREAGIRQSAEPVENNGLAAVDQWLDQRIGDQALLLVLALQFTPDQPEDTAEVVVGLLLGNRLTQSVLPPMAYLHRPEQERQANPDDLLCATRQALDWVPLQAQSIEQVWRVGIDAQRNATLAAVLAEVPLPAMHNQGLCNLDDLLGHPGPASPWLAIAAATQTIGRGTGSQFIFSGGDIAAGLWCTVLTPVSLPT